MFRSTRMVVGLAATSGVSILAVVGWLSGFFGSVATRISDTWTSLMTWLDEPTSFGSIALGAGAVLAPIVIMLIIIFIIIDP